MSYTDHFYLSEQDQTLEVRRNSSTNALRQYTWGDRYVDDLLLRQRDTDSNGTLDETLYPLHDSGWNVVALADTSGTVVERFKYDPYGNSTVLDGNFALDSDGLSDYDWEYRFTSRQRDAETGLHYFRARYYHDGLGRFIGRDPLSYIDGGSLYSGYFVPNGVDPWGLDDEWHHALCRDSNKILVPFFEQAGFTAAERNSKEFGWMIDAVPHRLGPGPKLNPNFTKDWTDFFKDNPNAGREQVLDKLKSLRAKYEALLPPNTIRDAIMGYSDWGDPAKRVAAAKSYAKAKKAATRIPVIKRVGGAIKIVGIVTFVYIASTDSVQAAVEQEVSGMLFPLPDIGTAAAGGYNGVYNSANLERKRRNNQIEAITGEPFFERCPPSSYRR